MHKKETLADRRKRRLRYKLKQRAGGRVRLSVFRSNKHIYAQLIDDASGKTLAAASTNDKDIKKAVKTGSTVSAAEAVGSEIAKRGKAAKVGAIAFDRSGYIYHGRVKALADAARAGGLDF